MKNNSNLQIIKKTIENLPHAFDFEYWNMSDTTFKDETFLAMILAMNIKQDEALKIQSKVMPRNKILRNILREKVVESMGRYGEYNGIAFFGTEKKFY